MEMLIIKAQMRLIKWRDRFNLTQNHNPKHHVLIRQDCEHSNLELCDDRLTDCERGDVPGWVLVVLMTTGLVTAIWTIAAPRLSAILRNSLDAMNGIR